MPITLQHPHVSDLDAMVISGIDSGHALGHLCHSLEAGGVFDHAELVIVDVTDMPEMGDISVSCLLSAAQTLAHRHQCLAVVDGGRRPVDGDVSRGVTTYPDLGSALRAGRRYFRFVSGRTGRHTFAGDVADTALALSDTAVRKAFSVAAGLTRSAIRR